MKPLAMLLSALVPGLGQLLRGRLADGALFFMLTFWLRLTLGGLAWHAGLGDQVAEVMLWGFPVLPPGHKVPLAIFATVVIAVLHVWACLDAREGRARLQVVG